MKKYTQFIVFWAGNSALLFLASTFFPERFALGNNIFTPLQAAVFTGLVWTYAVWRVEPTLKEFEVKLEGNTYMMLAYLAANFVVLWLLVRFAFISGFGAFSFVWVLALAAVANVIQYLAWNYTQKAK